MRTISSAKTNLDVKARKLRKKVNDLDNMFRDLGIMTFLCGQSDYHQNFTSGHILAYVVPAMKAGKYKIFYKNSQPRGFISWAHLSDDISQQYQEGDYVLGMDDVDSGDNIWITEFVTPYDEENDRNWIIKNLKEDLFKDDKVKVLIRNEDGSLKKIFTSIGNNFKK